MRLPVLICALLLGAALCAPFPATGAATAARGDAGGAPASLNQTVNELITLLDGSSKRRCMESLDTLRKAGFTYQKQLTVPPDMNLTCKDKDERSVIAGMRAVDWDYALFFGEPVAMDKVGAASYREGRRHIVPPPLKQAEWRQIQKNPGSAASCEIMVRRSVAFQRKMLEGARTSPAVLEALGARMYGAALESLYITAILVLAAEESDSLDPLKDLHTGSFERQSSILEALLRNRHLGAHARFRERAEFVRTVLHLLRKNREKPGTRDLAQVLELVQPERDRYLTPCPR